MKVFVCRTRCHGPWKSCQRSKSLTSSLLLLQQCTMNLNLCSYIETVLVGILSYISLFVICTLHDVFNAALNIRVYAPSTFFPSRIKVSVHVIVPYRNMDSIADLKKFLLRFSDILDFQIMFMLFSAYQAWAILIFIFLYVDPIELPRYFKLLTCFIQWPFLLVMFISLFRLEFTYSLY